MATANLSRGFVANLPGVMRAAAKRRIFDDRVTGFFLEVSPSGRMTYWLRYTDARGRRRDTRIGRHGEVTPDQARRRAVELKAAVTLGGDPAGERDRRRAVPTFAGYVPDRFIPHARATLRSAGEYEAMARLWLVPALGHLHLDQITAEHVAALGGSLSVAGLSPARRNRCLAALRRAMSLALEWGLYPGPNPARSPRMLREEPREHFLVGLQLRAMLGALAADPDRAAASAIALLALTGARKSEVLEAQWAHVDLERALLTVPRSKSGRRRHVVLSSAAVAILRLQPRVPSQVHVFPSPRIQGRPIESVRSAWARAKAAAGLPPGTRLHDLRHSFASLCVGDGVPLYDVSKLLGHSNQSVTVQYSHLRDDRLLAAANVVGSIVSAKYSSGEGRLPAFGTCRHAVYS